MIPANLPSSVRTGAGIALKYGILCLTGRRNARYLAGGSGPLYLGSVSYKEIVSPVSLPSPTQLSDGS